MEPGSELKTITPLSDTLGFIKVLPLTGMNFLVGTLISQSRNLVYYSRTGRSLTQVSVLVNKLVNTDVWFYINFWDLRVLSLLEGTNYYG